MPGIGVRPPPSIAVACSSVTIDLVDMRLMMSTTIRGLTTRSKKESQGDLTFEPRERSTEAAMDAAVSKQPETQSEMPPDAR
jgi:hypothetical protein